MKRFMKAITDSLADAAVREMGVETSVAAASAHKPFAIRLKTFFQNFSIIMADAALLELGVFAADSLNDHRPEQDLARPDDCQYGDNDLCFV